MEEESPAIMVEPQSAVPPPAMEDENERESNEEDELMFEKAQALMNKITASPDNPKPHALHALASILESQESSYMEEADHSSLINGRAAYNIGRLGNLLRDNDEFFELLSAKFLSDTRYPISVQAAALRLLYSCSLTWMYPHVFEETVVENIKAWVLDDKTKSSTEGQNWKQELGLRQSSDSEMLRTYSTGLLAVCLAGEGQVVEDVLTSGLPAKLIRYLRIRALGETSTSQKEAVESGNASAAGSMRIREEGQSRFRQVLETHHLDPPRIVEQGSFDDAENDRNRNWLVCSDKHWVDDGEPPDGLGEDLYCYEANAIGGERWHDREVRDRKPKFGDWNSHDRPVREEHFDESVRDDSSRRRENRECARSRGKTRVNESAIDRNLARNLDKRIHDAKKSLGSVADGLERDDNDDCFQECKFGSKDISDLVKKAVRAAEAEARTVNAPTETIRAVGDMAAEVVKSAALEVFKITNDEEAAVLAASRASSAVIDAGTAVEALRSSSGVAVDGELMNSGPTKLQSNEEVEEFFILDSDSLAMLREKFCIQCLGILGKYNVVCGQMMHEKGVDVCLALLQRSSTHTEASKIALLLPDVLMFISALAGHHFFSTLFVDRGGIQKLLTVPRISSTFVSLSSCLYEIGSLQGLERVCALPSDVINQVIELALQLLECPQDQARKNAPLFFAAAFVFRAIVDSFDALDGLQKLLNPLRNAATIKSGSLQNNRSQEVLTSSEKQIAYHTTIALHQYFRAHLLLLVDSIRPVKTNRSVARNVPSHRAAYKPLDIRSEAMDALFRQIQKDRKLGPAILRARWPAVDKFFSSNGHITMLELCLAPPDERYLHELGKHALGVLHIVTLVPHGRKLVVNATVSNDRLGIAVILDATNGAGYIDPEIIKSALNVLVNLVCPPPSISNKPTLYGQGQSSSVHTSNAPAMDRERNSERNITEQAVHLVSQNDPRERNGESGLAFLASSVSQTPFSAVTSGLVGDGRISLGGRAGCAGLAAQLEQGYHQARDAVRANNGIKVLLQLLRPRIIMPSPTLDCLLALACRVLLGLARDDTIAHILTKLQVGKKLSDLIRDSGNQLPSGEQGRWQAELAQVAIELISIVTNSGRASTLAATDAATPTLRRIERAAIAAATPITYHSRELLLLMHEHLQASGLATTAATLLKEAQLTPLPSLVAKSSIGHQISGQEPPSVQIQWPSGRTACGFSLSEKCKKREDSILKHGLKKKALVFSSSKVQLQSYDLGSPSVSKINSSLKKSSAPSVPPETPSTAATGPLGDADNTYKTPIVLPMKRKLTDSKDLEPLPLGKRINTSEHVRFKDQNVQFLASGGPVDGSDENQNMVQTNDLQSSSSERLTLDSIVLQYLKHQHRQCPAPITTLPPLSLLHPHVCPESKRSLDTPNNVTARISTREFRSRYNGIHGSRMDRQFVYSRFRPWRICRDDTGVLFTCLSFLGDSSHIAAGTHSGELKIFDSNRNSILESSEGHNYPLTIVQSHFSGDSQLILSSSARDVRLWDAPSVSGGPKYSFEGCKAARFSHCGTMFAAISSEIYRQEVLLYDVQTCKSDLTLTDTSTSFASKGTANSLVHFSPSDVMLLWNGALWDRRVPGPVHRFDQFSDYGGGGFHPARNEVIINNEVWDLRNFSLEQTSITFNASGDVIYAIMRRNTEDVTSALRTHHLKHPLFAAFRTVDAINYTEIATTPVDRCVIDFTTEPSDSFVGLVTIDDQEEMYSSARVYEIGRRKPTDDDSDPDDADESEVEDDDDDDDDGESDDHGDMSNDDDSLGDDDDDGGDGGFMMDGGDVMFETDEDDDDSEFEESVSSGDEEEYIA